MTPFAPSMSTTRRRLTHSINRWLTESSPQFGQTTTSVPKQGVVIAHAKRCQNSSDPVGQTDALGDEFAPFANAPSGILIGLVGNRHHRAHARLASQPSEKCPKQ